MVPAASRPRRDRPRRAADPDAWWPLVLEDIRHTVSFPFSAAAEYAHHGGTPQVITAQAALGLPHPELQLAARLAALQADSAGVTELYTKLQACRMPGHYCAPRAATALPRAKYTYAYPYGDDPVQREQSLTAAATAAARATQLRGRHD